MNIEDRTLQYLFYFEKFYAAQKHYVGTWQQREHHKKSWQLHQQVSLPASSGATIHSNSTRATTKRRNGERITYHSNHPHHRFGSLRGRIGAGDHLGQNPDTNQQLILHHSPRVPSLCRNKRYRKAEGYFFACWVGIVLSFDGRAKLSQSEPGVWTRCAHLTLTQKRTPLSAHAFSISLECFVLKHKLFSECR